MPRVKERRAEKIALDIINGNRNDARAALLNSQGKMIVVEVIDELSQYCGNGTIGAVAEIRTLLGGRT